MKIKLSLNPDSIDAAVRQLRGYAQTVDEAAEKIAKRLADTGYEVAYGVMAGHVFTGETINSLKVTQEGVNRYVLSAGSTALLFFEFGSGLKGGGHPMAGQFGYGPGTYPGKGHWNDPNGWWYPTDDPRLIVKHGKDGQGYGHSYGNPPRMPFYLADREIRDNILRVAREVITEGGETA